MCSLHRTLYIWIIQICFMSVGNTGLLSNVGNKSFLLLNEYSTPNQQLLTSEEIIYFSLWIWSGTDCFVCSAVLASGLSKIQQRMILSMSLGHTVKIICAALSCFFRSMMRVEALHMWYNLLVRMLSLMMLKHFFALEGKGNWPPNSLPVYASV